MTDTLTRRMIVASLATAGAADIAPFLRPAKAATAADTPGPIETGYAAYEALAKAYDDACVVTWAAEDRYEEPERPGWHPARDEGGHKIVPTTPGKGRVYLDVGAENVAYLRQLIEAPETVFTAEGWEPGMFPPRVESACTTLARIEAWQTEATHRADAAGLPAAREAEEQAGVRAKAKARALLSIEPTTFREVAFQAAIIEAAGFDEASLVSHLLRLAGIRLYWLVEG